LKQTESQHIEPKKYSPNQKSAAVLVRHNKLANVVIIVANVENYNNLFGLYLFKTFNFEIQQIANVTEKQGTQ